jgi:tetratricopeptide (TPR) repeat protein
MKAHDPSSPTETIPSLETAYRKGQEARQAISGGRYQQAVDLANEGLALLEEIPPTEGRERLRFVLLLERGRARALSGDYAALADFQAVRSGSQEPALRAEALVGIAHCYSGTGDYQTAESAYRIALEEALENRSDLVCIRGWIGLGALFWRQGRIEEAVQALHEAHTVLQRKPDIYELGRVLINLGIAHTFAGRLDKAITAYHEALKCFRTLQDDHRAAAVLNNLGEIYQELRDLDQALRYHEEAITLAVEAGAERVEVDITRNIGVDLLLMSRYSEAMMCLEKALSRAREIGDKDLALQALYSLGDALLRQGSVERAMAVAGELTAEAEAVGSELHIARAKFLQGRSHLACGERRAAQAVLQEALKGAHALPSRVLLWQLHAALGRTAEDPEIAQVHFRIAADFIRQTAEPLNDSELRSRFLEQPEVQAVLERAK